MSKDLLSLKRGLLNCLKRWLELRDSFNTGTLSLLLSSILPGVRGLLSNLLGVLHLASIRFLKLPELRIFVKFTVLLKPFESLRVWYLLSA